MGHNLACQQGLPSPGGVSANPPLQRRAARLVARREGAARTKKPRRSGAKAIFQRRGLPLGGKPHNGLAQSVAQCTICTSMSGLASKATSIREVADDSAEVGRQARRLNGAADAWLHSAWEITEKAPPSSGAKFFQTGLPSCDTRQTHRDNTTAAPDHRKSPAEAALSSTIGLYQLRRPANPPLNAADAAPVAHSRQRIKKPRRRAGLRVHPHAPIEYQIGCTARGRLAVRENKV